jgi:hypothetical protein
MDVDNETGVPIEVRTRHVQLPDSASWMLSMDVLWLPSCLLISVYLAGLSRSICTLGGLVRHTSIVPPSSHRHDAGPTP